MDNWIFLGRCLVAGGMGAWAVSFLIHLYNAIRYPQMLGDGQYAMIFLLTVPVGWVLGSIVGKVIAYFTVPPPYPPFWQVLVLVVGGVLGSPIVILSGGAVVWLTIILPVELLTRWFR
jgi:hypothetical protein